MTIQEKRKAFADCLKKLSDNQIYEYDYVLECACRFYREIYVLPYFEKIGKTHASMEFDMDYLKDGTVASYWPFKNRIKINLMRVMKRSGREKIKAAFSAVMSVAHEYRHNIQREIAMSIYAGEDLDKYYKTFGKEIQTSGLDFIDERAGRVLVDEGKRVQTILEFYPELIDDLKQMAKAKDLEALTSICKQAIYYQSAIEKDARKWEREIALTCVQDMKEFFSENDAPLKLLRKAIEKDIKTENDSGQSYQPIVNKLNLAFQGLKPAKFEAFAKQMYQVQVKGLRAFQQGEEDERLLKQEKQMRDLLHRAITLYAGKNIDIRDKQHKLKMLKQLRLLFVKHGYMAAAEVLKDAGFLAEIDFVEEYFAILKKEDVTLESFDKIKMLSIGKINDLIKGYIEEGKTEFVIRILQKKDHELIKSLLVWQSHTYQLKRDAGEVFRVPAELDYVLENNLYLSLQERLIKLQQMKREGNLLFDDVDDYIKMLAAFCKMVGVDISKEKQSFDGSEMLKEVRYTLHELYKNAEAIAYEYACLRKGYKLTKDEYQYACEEDRKLYLLKEKDRELRIKRIYGESEYNRVVAERQAVEDYMQECELGEIE